MTLFMGSAVRIPSSWVILAIMFATLLWKPAPDRDVCIFLAGSLLGIFLEDWGTSRQCWTYYTEETPPVIAVLAHGFASVTFNRGVQLLELGLARLRRPAPAAS